MLIRYSAAAHRVIESLALVYVYIYIYHHVLYVYVSLNAESKHRWDVQLDKKRSGEGEVNWFDEFDHPIYNYPSLCLCFGLVSTIQFNCYCYFYCYCYYCLFIQCFLLKEFVCYWKFFIHTGTLYLWKFFILLMEINNFFFFFFR